MINPLQSVGRALLVTPELVVRALDDLHDVANLARRSSEIEAAVFGRVDRIETRLTEVRDRLDRLTEVRDRLDRLRTVVAPIRNLEALHDSVRPLDPKLDRICAVIDDLGPQITAVSATIGALPSRLDDLQRSVEPLGELAGKLPGVGR